MLSFYLAVLLSVFFVDWKLNRYRHFYFDSSILGCRVVPCIVDVTVLHCRSLMLSHAAFMCWWEVEIWAMWELAAVQRCMDETVRILNPDDTDLTNREIQRTTWTFVSSLVTLEQWVKSINIPTRGLFFKKINISGLNDKIQYFRYIVICSVHIAAV